MELDSTYQRLKTFDAKGEALVRMSTQASDRKTHDAKVSTVHLEKSEKSWS
jgi:hypothetical protein